MQKLLTAPILATLAAAKRLVVSGDQAGPPGAAASAVADEAGGFARRIEEAWRAAGQDAHRALEQRAVSGVERAHRRDEGDLLALAPRLARDLAHHVDAADQFHGVQASQARARSRARSRSASATSRGSRYDSAAEGKARARTSSA